jgi:hypothetical protein
MALEAEVRSGRAIVFVSTLLLGRRLSGGPMPPQHTRSRRQSHLPTREMFDIPDEAPRFTLRDDCLNSGLVGCNANPSHFQHCEQD